MERTVHLGNVSSYVQEDAIRELLSACGTIRGVRCGGERNYDTRYWFVEFSAHREAQSACLFDNTILGDRKLRVSMAKKPKFGDSLPTGGATPNPIPPAALMLAPGVPLMPQPLMASILPPGYNMPTAGIGAPRRRHLMHNPKKVGRTIYIQNMDRGFREQDVADHFSPFGEVTAVRISDSCASSRRAWVEFADEGSVSQALCLDGETFGSCVLKISRSRTAIHTNGLERLEQDVAPPGTTRYGDDQAPGYQGTHFLDSAAVEKVSLGVRKRDPSDDGRSPDRGEYKRLRGEAVGLESSS